MLWILIIAAFLVLMLMIIRFSPLRGRLERFDRERPERDAKTEEELRLRPLSFVLTVLFSCFGAFGLIYIFAFSDTVQDRWQHFYFVFPVFAFVGTCLAFAKKREDSVPLSVRTRRTIWIFVLVGYLGVVALILRLGASPFTRVTDTLRLLCYLGGLSPLAFVAWKLIRSNEEG